jgi:hypothetical protein
MKYHLTTGEPARRFPDLEMENVDERKSKHVCEPKKLKATTEFTSNNIYSEKENKNIQGMSLAPLTIRSIIVNVSFQFFS